MIPCEQWQCFSVGIPQHSYCTCQLCAAVSYFPVSYGYGINEYNVSNDNTRIQTNMTVSWCTTMKRTLVRLTHIRASPIYSYPPIHTRRVLAYASVYFTLTRTLASRRKQKHKLECSIFVQFSSRHVCNKAYSKIRFCSLSSIQSDGTKSVWLFLHILFLSVVFFSLHSMILK